MKQRILLSLLLLSFSCLRAAPKPEYGRIELLRDSWGIPHLFSTTDAGAMYGLGYATAEDRGFQMTYSLRIIQGRLAEVVGEVRQGSRNDTSLDNDRKMRTFGFHRAAQRTAGNLDSKTRALLEAYCAGVNDSFTAQQAAGTLHPLFKQLAVTPEPWTPADCLASWWHLGQFFATDGTRELMAWRNRADTGTNRPARGQAPGRPAGRGVVLPTLPADAKKLPPDDAPAVVKRADVPADWLKRVERYAREQGLTNGGEGVEGPKFSHAWVVGGKHTTTGSAVLVSDPQTMVRNPSLWYEFHLQGKTFNARGIGVPGSPILLIGFTEQVAWGVTALGADQADLFRLETDLAHPDAYCFDGQWRPMTVHREQIRIKGREPLELVVRETHLGPVATAFCFPQPGDSEVALKRVPVCDTNGETIQGAMAMMRAENAREFDAALSGWRFPSINILFGDRSGDIGYRTLAAVPVRSRLDPSAGLQATPGHSTAQDWQGLLPFDLLPHVMNPGAGFLYSANHRPVESWYPIPLGVSTGGGGDTMRSWRLRERLQAKPVFSPEEVREIHFDTVNPARREITRLGLHLRDVLKRKLSEEAQQALVQLEPWYRAGASSSFQAKGAEVAIELSTFFRFMNTSLAYYYGGGEAGLAYFLKTAAARLDHAPKADFSAAEQDFIDQSLATAWRAASQKYGDAPATWNQKAQAAVGRQRLGYFASLDGFPSLDPAMDLSMPALADTDGGTLASQGSQSYTQWVPMQAPDEALTLLPIGESEQPESPSRTSMMELWAQGRLHPAPLSRKKVETMTVSRQKLDASRAAGPPPHSPAPARAPAKETSVAPATAVPSPTVAKLEPPAGRVVHGMGQWEEHNQKLLPALPSSLRPAAQMLFVQIGDSPRGWRPQGLTARLQALGRDGFVPVLNISLHGNQPTKAEVDKLPDPLFGIDHQVASSTNFDSRLEDVVHAVREFGLPVVVRIGGEFNGWWTGYHPYAYPKAFRKIVEMFRAAGARNAAFCWCYEPAGPGDFEEKNAAGESKWFPGADVVDWFAIDWFNREDFSGPLLGGRQGRELTAHGRSRKFLDLAVSCGKPVMIAESAPCHYDLSIPAQADAAWREWFVPYFRILAERPEIKWFHLISYDWARAKYWAGQDWKNNDFTANPDLLQRLSGELAQARYLHSPETKQLNAYNAMTLPGTTWPVSPTRAPASLGASAMRAGSPARILALPADELAKWDNAAAFLPPSGPGGTEWDGVYRSFIQTDANATAKGFPTHAEAAARVVADAATGSANLQKHRGWVLYIKHYSSAYRPETATADLRKLYETLCAKEAGPAAGKPPLPFEGDARLRIFRDVVYGQTQQEMQKLDAYLVKSSSPTPVLLEIHGGGWRRGQKSQFVYRDGLLESILGAGISVISIDYRLTPAHPFPAQMQDVARAIQFLRSKAKEWNLAPDRLVALGSSAGAHLAAWVALHDDLAQPGSADPVARQSTRLCGFVALAGPMDLTRVRPSELARQPLRGQDFANAFTAAFACSAKQFEQNEDLRQQIRNASPVFLVTPDDPPGFIMAAATEEMSPGHHPPVPEVLNDPHSAWQGVLLADALAKAGVPVTCRLGPQVGKDPAADNAATLDFVRRRLLP